jgi:ATPase subunit of ABC transporter with duplicated ATPase domains
LENVAKWILELDRGQGIPFEGNYSQWLDAKNKRLEGEKKADTAAAKAVAAELEWVRSNPKAKGVKSKARLRRYDELLLAAAPTEMRTEGQIYIPPGPRLGDVVIDVAGVRKAFGDRLLFDGLDFNLPKAGIVGVIGPNGAGMYRFFSHLLCNCMCLSLLHSFRIQQFDRQIHFNQNANGKRYTRCRHNYSR